MSSHVGCGRSSYAHRWLILRTDLAVSAQMPEERRRVSTGAPPGKMRDPLRGVRPSRVGLRAPWRGGVAVAPLLCLLLLWLWVPLCGRERCIFYDYVGDGHATHKSQPTTKRYCMRRCRDGRLSHADRKVLSGLTNHSATAARCTASRRSSRLPRGGIRMEHRPWRSPQPPAATLHSSHHDGRYEHQAPTVAQLQQPRTTANPGSGRAMSILPRRGKGTAARLDRIGSDWIDGRTAQRTSSFGDAILITILITRTQSRLQGRHPR